MHGFSSEIYRSIDTSGISRSTIIVTVTHVHSQSHVNIEAYFALQYDVIQIEKCSKCRLFKNVHGSIINVGVLIAFLSVATDLAHFTLSLFHLSLSLSGSADVKRLVFSVHKLCKKNQRNEYSATWISFYRKIKTFSRKKKYSKLS